MLEDLFTAYYDARKHKRNSINQLRFELDYESNLIKLRDELLSGKYEISQSICFIIFDPVQREIMAADFRDRVVHHLIYNYINPILEKQFITDSYSCRAGKGTHYGINRMKHFIKECSKKYTTDCYILKLDIKGYFMGINKNMLWEKLNLMLYSELPSANLPISPELLMKWLKKIVFHNSTENCIFKSRKSAWKNLPPDKSLFNSKADCGLPIGNLTSQLFSNVYLHNLDVFVKNELNFQYYGRYVDDFIIMHEEKDVLLKAKKQIEEFLLQENGLKLHPKKFYLQHYTKGVPFLGAYIKPNRCYIGNRTKKKFFKAVKQTDIELNNPQLAIKEIEHCRAVLNSYLGLLQHFNTYNIRQKALFGKKHLFFKYGYLAGRLKKYKYVVKKH